VRRRVAVKIIKPGLDSRQVIARFEAERQALAMMDHENITRVLDAGTTDNGHPYFATELIRGIPITEFCDKHRLSLRERLELFIPVCQAIQHAHQKGIIHRDIKPSNILVTHYDGRPVPKVIDFGVAKAIGQPLTERTMFTRYGQVIGTLEYMSPEQSELSQLDVDTRSDIYSLGVLLYELLTGTTPIERNRVASSSFHEILRLIREEEAQKPSTRLSASAISAPPTNGSRMDRSRWASVLRGDLDWIVMKALEKDRSRRYATANALAADVSRYLHHEPIEARPPSAVYRLSKLATKYRNALGIVIAFASLLVLGTVISLYQAVRAIQATTLAKDEKLRADGALVQEAIQRERAERLAAESHARLVRLYVTTGSNAAEQVEWPTALLWYAKAWSVDDRQTQEPNHRQRFAAVIDRLRRPEDICFHDGLILHAQWDNAGQHLLTLTSTNKVAAWNLSSRRRATPPRLPAGKIQFVDFSADGRSVATCIEDRVHYWDVDVSKRTNAVFNHPAKVFAATFSPDGELLATAGADHIVRFWNVDDGTQRDGQIRCQDEVHYVGFSPAGDHIVTVDKSETARVWRADSLDPIGEPLRHRLRPGNPADDLFQPPKFSPDGLRLLTAHDRTVTVWDLVKAAQAFVPVDTGMVINGVGWNTDGTQVLVVGRSTGTLLLAAIDGSTVNVLAHPREVQCGCFHPTSPLAATASSAGVVHLWYLDGREARSEVLCRHAGNVLRMSFSPDGKYLVTAGQDGTARIWSFESPTTSPEPYLYDCGAAHHLTRIPAPGGGIWAVSPDGKRIVHCGDGIGAAVVVREPHAQNTIALNHDEKVTVAEFCPNGGRIVTCGERFVQVWNTKDGSVAGGPWQLDKPVRGAWLSNDGSRLGIVDEDRVASVWDVSRGERILGPIQVLDAPADAARFIGGMSESTDWSGEIRAGALDPRGERLVLVARRFARVFNLDTKNEVAITIHAGFFSSANFSPDGKRIVFAASDRTVRVWNAETGEPTSPPMHHATFARRAEFSPDGRRIVSVTSGGQISVWDANSGDLLLPALAIPDSTPDRAWFSRDGERIIYCSADESTRGQWTLPSYRGPTKSVLVLVHLLTGREVDATDGIVFVDRNRVLSSWPEYEAAWRTLESSAPAP
jgi:WD40 repeat protein